MGFRQLSASLERAEVNSADSLKTCDCGDSPSGIFTDLWPAKTLIMRKAGRKCSGVTQPVFAKLLAAQEVTKPLQLAQRHVE